MSQPIVVRSDDPRAADLAGRGWVVAARSWAAELSHFDEDALRKIVARASNAGVTVREIQAADLGHVLALDQDTCVDYPGGPATAHRPLTPAAATVTHLRQAFGAFLPDGTLVAMTFLDVDVDDATAETDFTVVARNHRGRGLAQAVKAFAVLALNADGVRTFRTGGSDQNPAIIAANAALGYVLDEEWLTYAPGMEARSARPDALASAGCDLLVFRDRDCSVTSAPNRTQPDTRRGGRVVA